MNTNLTIVDTRLEVYGRKDYINVSRLSEPKTGVLFSKYMLESAVKRSRRMSPDYTKNYNTVANHLNNFSIENNVNLYINSINEEFLEDFIEYLEQHNEKLNYIEQLIGLIKTTARKAGSSGYLIDPTFENVIVKHEETFATYLTNNDIVRIYYYKGLTKFQERVRDLFIIGCLTALRYSDYSTLAKENFTNNTIVKVTKKTNTKVVIPIHQYVKDIYDKYNGELIFGLSCQHFNRMVKLICKKIGFNDVLNFTHTKGGKVVMVSKLKWELISSHTARRSAATNMVLLGIPFYKVMKITGHTTEKSLSRYIKVTHEDVAKQLAGNLYFNT